LGDCALLLVAARRLAERVTEDKALQKAMAEMMERMSYVEI